jgi:hypothetical protein
MRLVFVKLIEFLNGIFFRILSEDDSKIGSVYLLDYVISDVVIETEKSEPFKAELREE